MDPSGTAIAVWELTLPAETRPQFAVRPAGGGWGPAADLPANRLEGARSPQIALDADGSALAAWIDDDAGLTRVVSAVRPAGGTWGAGERRSASAPDARDALPALAMLPGGRAVLAWWRGDAGGAHVQAALREAVLGQVRP